jgi:hypothetical protein
VEIAEMQLRNVALGHARAVLQTRRTGGARHGYGNGGSQAISTN